jgi:PleD family two-component response regulator
LLELRIFSAVVANPYRFNTPKYLCMKPANKSDLERSFHGIERFLEKKVKNPLIVEDDQNLRKSIRILIEDKDVNCFEAETGKETLSIIKKHDIDCMIVDIGLPDMTGYEVIRK